MTVSSENEKEAKDMIYKFLKEDIEKKDGILSEGYPYPQFKRKSLHGYLKEKVGEGPLYEIFTEQKKVQVFYIKKSVKLIYCIS